MIKYHALHGFLGLPEEWNTFDFAQPVTLWNQSHLSLWSWAKEFNKHHSGNLMGYSMGGRLALHALIDNPEQWDSAVIVSAHPGQGLDEERIQADKDWAKRFLSDDWNGLMDDWNAQAVLSNSSNQARSEHHYNRSELANALTNWSRGNQENLTKAIEQLTIPILWITGELDKPFTEIAEQINFSNPNSKHVVVPNTGHRVIWEQPNQFRALVNEWGQLYICM